MPRLFTALEIPREHRERLAFSRIPLPGAKWVAAEDMHITLRFLGDVDARSAEEFDRLVANLAVDSFEITIAGAGAFGGNDPHSVWADVKAEPELVRLNQAHERAARDVGLPPDARGFQPHVTLARLRNSKPEPVARALSHLGKLSLPPFKVTRAVLMSSRPGVGGGPYGIEATYPFRGEIDEELAEWR